MASNTSKWKITIYVKNRAKIFNEIFVILLTTALIPKLFNEDSDCSLKVWSYCDPLKYFSVDTCLFLT